MSKQFLQRHNQFAKESCLKIAICAFSLAVASLVNPTPSFAQGLVMFPEAKRIRSEPIRPRPIRPRPVGQITPLVKSQRVSVTINDQLAVTSIEQEFFNPTNIRCEGKYIFPIPSGATISQFSMWMNGKEMQGEILDSNKARKVYEGIVRRMQDPALLEFLGQGMFQARIFPIEARSSQKIKLTYSQTLKKTQRRCSYQFIQTAARLCENQSVPFTVSMTIKSSQAITGLFSPSHDAVIVRKGDKAARVSYETSDLNSNKPFELHYDLVAGDIELSLRDYRRNQSDGYFMVTVSPNPNYKTDKIPPKDVVFVLDTSGSMAGDDMKSLRLRQAQKALKSCLNYLSEKDRFNIVAFSMEARLFNEEMQLANTENKSQAFDFIDSQKARGATALEEALLKTLALQSAESNRPFTVVLISDGKPTFGETDEKRLLKSLGKKLGRARIFSFGIGTAVNSRLLDSIAMNSRGDREYVLDDEEIEFKISSFYDKFAFPVLSSCELKVNGLELFDVYPRRLPDLFKGQSVTVFGRYKQSGKAKFTLSGTVGEDNYSKQFNVEFSKQSLDMEFLPTLWASRKIAVLLEQIRLNGEHKELKDEVVRLAKHYGIPSPYTSYLVVEDERQELGGSTSPGSRERGGRRLRKAVEKAFGGGKDQSGTKGSPRQSGNDDAEMLAPKADGTGKANVEESMALKKLKEGKNSGDLTSNKRNIRRIGDRVFYNADGMWFEASLKDDEKVSKQLVYLSEDYFSFLQKNSEIAAILSIGNRIRFRHAGGVIEVVLKP